MTMFNQTSNWLKYKGKCDGYQFVLEDGGAGKQDEMPHYHTSSSYLAQSVSIVSIILQALSVAATGHLLFLELFNEH